MQKLLRSIGNAVPVAIMTAIAWYFGNEFLKDKNGGFFDRQPWPINNIFLCIGLTSVAAVAVSFITLYLVDRRNSALKSVAESLGLKYREQIRKSDLGVSGTFHILDDWKDGTNHIHGRFEDAEVQVFDFLKQYTTYHSSASSGGSNSNTVRQHQTVILLPLEEGTVENVQILRKNAVSWILDALGFDGVEFSTDDHFASEQDRATIHQFNEAYLVVRGLSRNATSGRSALTGDELDRFLRKLEATIGMSLIEQLLKENRWSLEVGQSHIAVWVHKQKISPSALQECLRHALQIRSALLDGPESGPAKLKAKGEVQVKAETSIGRIGPIAVSGCLGMALAFALFIPIFFVFADRAPWIVFIWPFFGMAVVAGSVLLGTRLARKWRKSQVNIDE